MLPFRDGQPAKLDLKAGRHHLAFPIQTTWVALRTMVNLRSTGQRLTLPPWSTLDDVAPPANPSSPPVQAD